MMRRLINTDLIKALRCLASQDENGDCYMERYNLMHMDGDEPEIYCGSKPPDGRVQCPYYQNKYMVCFEDGECGEWLEAIADILELSGECRWIPKERPPKNDKYILLSFENFQMPLVGRYEEDKEGGAYYIGDDEESCISQDFIVNAWTSLPEPYRETAESHPEIADGNEITSQDLEVADIEQAIDYFKDELSQMEVFSDIIPFREVERKSIEIALKLLQKVQEERQQDGSSQ